MCKRCENSRDAIQHFLSANWTDDAYISEEKMNEAEQRQNNYINEQMTVNIFGNRGFLCADGSMIIYDGWNRDFDHEFDSGFNYCPICGRKLG